MSRYDVEIQKWNEKSAQTLNERKNWIHSKTYEEVFTRQNSLRPAYDYMPKIGDPGTTVLDYGCGAGWTALLLATKAENVKAFDISEGRIKILEKYIEHNKIDNLEAIVANGEDMPYDNETFDYVFGNAILHHLILDDCLPEIARVLKPGGRAVFCEPYAHNPFINAFRFIKHHFFEDHVGTDRPLTAGDIEVFEKYFNDVEFVGSSLFSDRLRSLRALDRFLLRFRFLSRFSGYVTVLCEKGDKIS